MKHPEPEQIRAARLTAGLSQTAAAELIHSALRSWQDWEAGKRKMHQAMWELFQIRAKHASRDQHWGEVWEIVSGALDDYSIDDGTRGRFTAAVNDVVSAIVAARL